MEQNCKTGCTCSNPKCTAKAPIFSALGKEELQKVYTLIVQQGYRKGDIIIQHGSIPRKFMIVKKGRIKIISLTPEGREQILYILNTSDFFGEHNLLRERATTYYVEAMEDSTICSIGKADFEQLMLRHPNIALKVMEGLSDRLEHMEALVKTISPKDVNTRITMLLLDLSYRYGQAQQGSVLIEVPMTREEMANYIGVARETLIRKLSSLKEEGIIDLIGHKKIKVNDMSRLVSEVSTSAPFI
jgi:CRP/FNR family transcriptional regulator